MGLELVDLQAENIVFAGLQLLLELFFGVELRVEGNQVLLGVTLNEGLLPGESMLSRPDVFVVVVAGSLPEVLLLNARSSYLYVHVLLVH